jgi:hypothetical protein
MTAARIPVDARSPGLLLIGAEPIADFLFPNDPRRLRRVYHLAEIKADGDSRPPIFRIGRSLATRPAALIAWVAEREARALSGGAR